MRKHHQVRLTAFGIWLFLIATMRFDGWYEVPVSIVPSWTKTLIGTTIIMLVGLRLRKLYWAQFIEKLGASDE